VLEKVCYLSGMHEVVATPSSSNGPLPHRIYRNCILRLAFQSLLAPKKQDIPFAISEYTSAGRAAPPIDPSEIALSLVPAPRNGGTVVLLAPHAGSVVAYRVGGLQGDCDWWIL
jgi:hypothetical protein